MSDDEKRIDTSFTRPKDNSGLQQRMEPIKPAAQRPDLFKGRQIGQQQQQLAQKLETPPEKKP